MEGKITYFLCLINCIIIFAACKSSKQTNSLPEGSFYELQTALLKKGEFQLDNKIYDLNGKTLNVNGKLIFSAGARIINGTLLGDEGLIESPNRQCFENIIIQGTWRNREGFMKWFTDGKDAPANFLALTNLVTMNAKILLDDIYSLATSEYQSFDSPNSLLIEGKNPKSCGFILETKSQRGNAYFRSLKGNNIHFKNISITTSDFINGQSPVGNDYTFASCSYSGLYPEARPDMDFFRLDNCVLEGAINFQYSASSKNTDLETYKTLGIDDITVKGCTIEGAATTLEVSNLSYKEVNIESNIIRNFFGPVFFFPAGGLDPEYGKWFVAEGRPIMQIKNNEVKNDNAVNGVINGYMAFVVAKGINFEVINNTIENVINLKDGIETVPFYCSAYRHLLVQGNKVRNVGSRGLGVGFGANCLLKLKGALQCDVVDNEFRFDKNGLVALGLLPSEKSDLQAIKPHQFRFALWGADLLNRIDSTGYYNFRNNTFEAAMISDHSFACRTSVTLTDNKFIIEYLSAGDPGKWNDNNQILDHTMIYLREPVENASLIVKNNTVQVKTLDADLFYFIRDINDNKSFKEVVYESNVFETDAVVSLAYSRSEKLVCKNTLKGTGSFAYNDVASLKYNRSVKNLDVVQQVEEYKSGATAAYHIKNFGQATIKTQNNTDSVANLVRISFNDLHYYNDEDQFPILLSINAKLTDKKGNTKKVNYRMVIGGLQEFIFWEVKTRKIKTVQPYWTEGIPDFCYDILPVSGTAFEGVNLSLVSRSRWKNQKLSGSIIFRGMEPVQEFEVTASTEKLNIPANADPNAIISGLVTNE